MRIETSGDASISGQARTYAEYRLFAALSQTFDTRRVRKASLAVRRGTRRCASGVVCAVSIEWDTGGVTRLRTVGEHPYAAINRAIERLRTSARRGREEPRSDDEWMDAAPNHSGPLA
jgi:ribosome-associated translation inhibitor RaiA